MRLAIATAAAVAAAVGAGVATASPGSTSKPVAPMVAACKVLPGTPLPRLTSEAAVKAFCAKHGTP